MVFEKQAIFMGKNTEGKYVIHFPGESYIYDVCLMEKELFNKGSIVSSKPVIQ